MKRYPKYKDSGIEWIGEIPVLWEVKPIKYVGEIVLGKMLTPDDKGGYFRKPYLRAQNITWEKVDTEDIKEMWFSENDLSQYRLKENDLLVSEGGEVGRTAIWQNELSECYIQNSVHKITIKSKNNPHYYLYHFQIYGKTGYFNSIVNRVSIAHLTREKLKEIMFLSPTLVEQQSIANYIDRKTHQIDTLIKNKQKLIDLLKEQRMAIINQAVTKGLNPNVKLKDSGIEWLGEIPEHWGIARLKFISNIKYGLGQPPRALEGGLPIIRATNIKEGKISPDDLLYVDPKDVPYDRDPILKENDIIVVRSGAYTGDSAIIPREYEGAVAGYDMVACVHKANPEYIAYSLLSHSILHNQIDLCRFRAAQPHLNAEEFGDTLVFLPPNDEQRMIVEFIKHESEMMVSINQNLEELIKCLKEYRTALISEVVTGKIDVRDSGEQEVIHS